MHSVANMVKLSMANLKISFSREIFFIAWRLLNSRTKEIGTLVNICLQIVSIYIHKQQFDKNNDLILIVIF